MENEPERSWMMLIVEDHYADHDSPLSWDRLRGTIAYYRGRTRDDVDLEPWSRRASELMKTDGAKSALYNLYNTDSTHLHALIQQGRVVLVRECVYLPSHPTAQRATYIAKLSAVCRERWFSGSNLAHVSPFATDHECDAVLPRALALDLAKDLRAHLNQRGIPAEVYDDPTGVGVFYKSYVDIAGEDESA